ncbi:hypothetical protein MRY82_06840 [bacterium]|nr:hypothetical protein [bacterium]
MRLKLFLLTILSLLILQCSGDNVEEEPLLNACSNNPCSTVDTAAQCSLTDTPLGYSCECSTGFLDTGTTCNACAFNDGQTTVDSTSGNTLFYVSGSWGVRQEDSYIYDDTNSTAYIVVNVPEPGECDNNLCDYLSSIYACNQSTGVKGAYQSASGLAGHSIIFFDSFSDLQNYRDLSQPLCESGN